MSANVVQWVLVVGVVVLCWILLSAVEELRSLNHKVEYWGKYLSGVADEIRATLNEMQGDASSLSHDVADISRRARERFPTEEEDEDARNNEP